MTSPQPFMNGSRPTVVLVHGAFWDASVWSDVIWRLQAVGLDVIAPADALRGAAVDGAYLASVVHDVDGPVLLVGHSYGGVVIDRAAEQAGNVVGLVYVAAFALDEGEAILDLNDRFPGALPIDALRPHTFTGADGEPAVELSLLPERFAAVFAADLPARAAAVGAAAQRPVVATAFSETSPSAAWSHFPTWFVVPTADRVIRADAQRFMAGRAGGLTLEVDASHAVALSQPAVVAQHIHLAAVTPRAAQQPVPS